MKTTKPQKTLLLAIAILFVLLLSSCSSGTENTPDVETAIQEQVTNQVPKEEEIDEEIGCEEADCTWEAPVYTWVDENENGVWDEGEPPVEGVTFQVNEISNNNVPDKDVGAWAVSNPAGEAEIIAWMPNCYPGQFEIEAFPPDGYQLVSEQAIKLEGRGYDDEQPVWFALKRDLSLPAPTPYAPTYQCTNYRLAVTDFTIAPDGAIWAALGDGAAIYQAESDEWEKIPFVAGFTVRGKSITVGEDGKVWALALNGIAKLEKGAWVAGYYTENVLAGIKHPIDQSIWFVVGESLNLDYDNTFARYDPVSSSWDVYGPRSEIEHSNLQVNLMKGGATWFARFEDSSEGNSFSDTPSLLTFEDRHTFTYTEHHLVPIRDWRELLDFEIDSSGNIWLVQRDMIYRFNPESGDWVRYNLEEAIKEYYREDEYYEVDSIALAPDDSLWVMLNYAGRYPLLIHYPPGKGGQVFDPRDGIPDFLYSNALAVDQDGNIWISYQKSKLTMRCTEIE